MYYPLLDCTREQEIRLFCRMLRWTNQLALPWRRIMKYGSAYGLCIY